MLMADFSSPVALVSADETDPSQYIAIERGGLAWFPKFDSTTSAWSMPKQSVQILDISEGVASIDEIVHMRDRNFLVWSQAGPQKHRVSLYARKVAFSATPK